MLLGRRCADKGCTKPEATRQAAPKDYVPVPKDYESIRARVLGRGSNTTGQNYPTRKWF